MKEFIINETQEGIRLDKQLLKILNNAGPGFVYKMLRKKNITLNDRKADGSEHLSTGDVIRIYLSDETFDKFSEIRSPQAGFSAKSTGKQDNTAERDPKRKGFPPIDDITVYEDDKILLVNKPAGILSQKAADKDVSINELCLEHLIEKKELTAEKLRLFKPSICNRLDRNTSGLIIFAKDYKTAAAVNAALKDRTIHKYYLCMAEGRIEEEGHYTGYLTKDREANRVYVSKEPEPGAARIETVVRPLKITDTYTLLEVMLITGKSHQIRAQLAQLGHPLLGDVKYGSGNMHTGYNKSSSSDKRRKGNDTDKDRTFQQLHAYKLSIPDDTEGALAYLAGHDFTARVPAGMEALIKDIFGVDINAYMEQQGSSGIDT